MKLAFSMLWKNRRYEHYFSFTMWQFVACVFMRSDVKSLLMFRRLNCWGYAIGATPLTMKNEDFVGQFVECSSTGQAILRALHARCPSLGIKFLSWGHMQ